MSACIESRRAGGCAPFAIQRAASSRQRSPTTNASSTSGAPGAGPRRGGGRRDGRRRRGSRGAALREGEVAEREREGSEDGDEEERLPVHRGDFVPAFRAPARLPWGAAREGAHPPAGDDRRVTAEASPAGSSRRRPRRPPHTSRGSAADRDARCPRSARGGRRGGGRELRERDARVHADVVDHRLQEAPRRVVLRLRRVGVAPPGLDLRGVAERARLRARASPTPSGSSPRSRGAAPSRPRRARCPATSRARGRRPPSRARART